MAADSLPFSYGYLLPQTQCSQDSPVTRDVFLHQVVQQTPTLTNKFQQTQLCAVIVLVNFQVFRQVTDPVSKQRDLGFGRPGVRCRFGKTRGGENLLLFFGR